jgi:hypothetical protein
LATAAAVAVITATIIHPTTAGRTLRVEDGTATPIARGAATAGPVTAAAMVAEAAMVVGVATEAETGIDMECRTHSHVEEQR